MAEDGLSSMDSYLIVKSAHFSISLKPGSLAVLCIPNEVVPKCAWWIIREYGRMNADVSHFHSVLMDDDGLSVICDINAVSVLKFLLRPEDFTLSPSSWRAIAIDLTGSAYEVPGAVYYLANSLSREGLSILHISTFESEVFLVQEPDLHKVCAILKEFQNADKAAALLDQASNTAKVGSGDTVNKADGNRSSDASGINAVISHYNESLGVASQEEDEGRVNFDMSWITPQGANETDSANTHISPPITFKEGFTLCVLPQPVILAKLNLDFDWSLCGPIMVSIDSLFYYLV